MTKRKSLTKKTRFEVFKRDNFTCQYCGSKSPDVILEIDHIKPVKNGGDNSIINLITSCFECNRGKGSRELKDNSIVEKQRIQIEELNLRRQQLEMLLEWRDGLKKQESEQHDKAIEYFNNLWDESVLSKDAEHKLIKYVDKYGLIKVLDIIDLSYSKYNYDGNSEEFNFNVVFSKLGSILHLEGKPDHIKKIAYIKGIARNKFGYINEKTLSIELNNAYENNIDFEDLQKQLIDDVWRNYSQFRDAITYFNDNSSPF